MADSDCIIVHEQVVVPEPVMANEVIALPGEKGDKGDPFTYDDFTPEQIAELQRPATEAAAVANQAAEKANKAVTDIKVLGVTLTAEEAKRESAESGRTSAESERAEAEVLRETSFSQMQTTLEGLITDTRTATSNANTAAGNAENAATEANNSATLANEAADKANQAAQNVDGRVTALEEKASQVYENLAAIEASGETNPNKIYIDGETMQPYVYKNGEFVPFSCQEDGTISIQRCIDLSEFVSSVTGVYRFDDTGYYIITINNFTKTDLYFKKIYTVNISNTSNRMESGVMRNVLCKIGNKIFFAACWFANPVYMYDEETSEGKYLDNPEGLQHYGAVYAYDNKVYYFHRYDKPHIYVYDADGNLVTNKAYDYNYIKITDGIAFTKDGYKVNLEDLTFEKLTFPNLEENINLLYVFSNGNMICHMSNISNENNTTSYNFGDIGNVQEYGYCINVDNRLTVAFTSNGKYVFRYPYGILNSTFRGVDADIVSQNNIWRQTNYKNFVYSTTNGNVLIIEDVSRYDTN